ncbi:winged helix-turn-helix domain-containing protein [Dysgonomonas sp. Marseille-P4677]|uniref:winged helix-turn-helix domain-containing protein n=1 Tax=Dysgonomonas sp. Marseille-P4677 TaxID=2364790 RepID=UPI00191470E3|nr:winged helix-turn-helix domain-containing protein [Dysgonomonas sp. Marseille-P4677]MBK5722270.1 winged helix-turn-helix domain-containing protein [Dysgonomonas sp. Marseille-P4677]
MSKDDVGNKSGTIWLLLSDKGKLSIREIGEFTNCKDSLIFLALGWLLREDKVRIIDMNGVLHVELKKCVSELYY